MNETETLEEIRKAIYINHFSEAAANESWLKVKALLQAERARLLEQFTGDYHHDLSERCVLLSDLRAIINNTQA